MAPRFALFRISSLGGITAPAIAPLAALALGQADKAIVLALMAAFVWKRHRDNIVRLIAGTEPKVGQKKPEDSE